MEAQLYSSAIAAIGESVWRGLVLRRNGRHDEVWRCMHRHATLRLARACADDELRRRGVAR